MALLTTQRRPIFFQVDVVGKPSLVVQPGEAAIFAVTGEAIVRSGDADILRDTDEINIIFRCSEGSTVGAGGVVAHQAVDVRGRVRIVSTAEQVGADMAGHATAGIGCDVNGKGGQVVLFCKILYACVDAVRTLPSPVARLENIGTLLCMAMQALQGDCLGIGKGTGDLSMFRGRCQTGLD